MKVKIALPKRGLEGFCQRWEIAELALFGSVLREDFGPGSDIDLLVRFQPGARRVLRPAAAAVTAVVALQWGCQLTCALLGSARRPHRAYSFFGRGAPSSPLLPPRCTRGHVATRWPRSWHARHDRSSFLDVHSRTL
mgnify:CR=1 FL=1